LASALNSKGLGLNLKTFGAFRFCLRAGKDLSTGRSLKAGCKDYLPKHMFRLGVLGLETFFESLYLGLSNA